MIDAIICIEDDFEDYSKEVQFLTKVWAVPPEGGCLSLTQKSCSLLEKKARSSYEIGRKFSRYLYGRDDELPEKERYKKVCFDDVIEVKGIIYATTEEPITIMLGR